MEPKSSQMADREDQSCQGQYTIRPWLPQRSYIMRTEQQVIEGLKALRMEIEEGMEEPEDQLLLLADVLEIMGLSEEQSRPIMGQDAWSHIRQMREPAPPAWPSRELLEQMERWPGVTLSPSWSRRLEAMRPA